jgi:N-acetylmuramoyl-L-alanine amidase
MRSCGKRAAAGIALIAMLAPGMAAAQQRAKVRYEQTLAREQVLRKALDSQAGVSAPLLERVRQLVGEYEALVRRYPGSAYSDNACYQGAVLSADVYWHFGEAADKRKAVQLFATLRAEYPSSSLIRQITTHTARFSEAPAPPPPPAPGPRLVSGHPILTTIKREVLADTLRITLQLEREAVFREERLDRPARVFIDLQNTKTVSQLTDATLSFSDDVVRKIRTGRQQNATRVVLDLDGAARHSVYALYSPYRVVIDIERTKPVAVAAKAVEPAKDQPGATWVEDISVPEVVPPTGPAPAPEAPPPAPPASNSKGGFSLSRQLGLGISRVVIDAGHGGHDPGAHIKGLNEADLALDVALRLEKLLLQVQGVEVVMTRRTNVFIPLEERTAIANRAGADLFLSIHVNASRNPRARGIETYFLNFAPNKEAEAIAARENAGSAKTMRNLPDIVRAIALNNKIDESRDLAGLVQTAMFDRLRKANRNARNLGVKQAPFMVLIGATMPSVLAEISFITNRQEATLLRSGNYRQAIADALFGAVTKYQRSLKAAPIVAEQ